MLQRVNLLSNPAVVSFRRVNPSVQTIPGTNGFTRWSNIFLRIYPSEQQKSRECLDL